MRKDKEDAISLRKDGKSYREIERTLGVSRSTLSDWFRDLPWSRHYVRQNSEKLIAGAKEKMMKMNMVRKIKLDYLYAKAEADAAAQYSKFKKDPLFWAGLMIYAGEGDKASRNLTRMSNTDSYLHKILIAFSLKYLDIDKEHIKFNLILYPNHEKEACEAVWAKELGISRHLFHKTQVIKGREAKKKLQYGIGISIISGTVSTKKKVLKWLDLAKETYK